MPPVYPPFAPFDSGSSTPDLTALSTAFMSLNPSQIQAMKDSLSPAEIEGLVAIANQVSKPYVVTWTAPGPLGISLLDSPAGPVVNDTKDSTNLDITPLNDGDLVTHVNDSPVPPSFNAAKLGMLLLWSEDRPLTVTLANPAKLAMEMMEPDLDGDVILPMMTAIMQVGAAKLIKGATASASDTDGLQAPFSMAMSKAMCSAMESVYAGGDSGDALKMVTDKMMSVVFADSIVQKMTDLPSPYALNIADAMQVGMKRTMGDGGVDGFGLAAMSAALAFPNTLFDEPKQPQVGRSHAGSSHVMVESAPPVIEESESSEEEEEEIAVEASKFEDGYFDENEVKEIMRRQSVDMKLEWDSKKAAATATANAKLKEQNDEMNRMRREHLDDVVDLEQLYDKLDIAEKELKKTRVEKENADYFAQHELDRLQRELEVEKEKAKQQGSEGFFSSESQLLHKKQQSHLQQQKQAMEQQKQAMEQQKQAMERQKQEIALQRPVSAGGVPAGIFLAEKCVQQGWVIAYTPQGKAYFQNNRTKQTSWTSPKPEQEAAAPAAGTGCPNRNNPHHSCNAYCLKTFGGGGGAGGGGDGGEWACQICTLSNPAKARFCTVCGKAKGTHTINTPFA